MNMYHNMGNIIKETTTKARFKFIGECIRAFEYIHVIYCPKLF